MSVAIALEIRERQKHHLGELLEIKKELADKSPVSLKGAIKRAVIPMDQEDVAWVEKLVGEKAL